ncbi:sugar ABC transporter ATP-binding protein [Klebsiella pneumoniae subsp. rhinoscleromatis]|nr:sugar ABC transporter ATP-binding protein [Klebsiella pneumoniae subsp. rhinoscleromatis]
MMKMLAGVETPSSGQIILDGEAVSLQSTHQAEKLGISIIFQELNLFPNMNVMDNIFMANEFFQKGRINEKYQYALAKSAAGTAGAGCRSLRSAGVNSVSATSS